MFEMKLGNMEDLSAENAKISDSGYSNTCSNSQSHTSESSASRNSNHDASSGYHGGNPSTFESSTETLPKPITKRENKVYKKKSKNIAALSLLVETSKNSNSSSLNPAPVASWNTTLTAEPCKPILDKATEEVAVIEMVDMTDPGVYNDNNLEPSTEAGPTSKPSLIDETSSKSTEENYAVISMHDGLVLHASSSLQASLGYPEGSWTGKVFIDLLVPKDKHILTETITSEIAISRDFCPSGTNGRQASIFCRLRRFSATDNNYLNSNGTSFYVPYRINLVVQNFYGDKLLMSQSQVMLLVASFQPARSAYTVPEEMLISAVFTTRHTATCRLSYVDPDVVQYLGYLPQDMIDRSLFDFYHPEDLPLIKEIYETVMNPKITSFRSKPYRFMVQNGCFVVLETEWLSFVNPWTKSLEFVSGQHRVLKGPADPNVFRVCIEKKNGLLANISEAVMKEVKTIQEEIKALLREGVQRKPSCRVTDCDLLSKKKEITTFVENILQEIKSPAPIKDHMAINDRSFSDPDSVILGGISTHHEYFDSKSSTETPPSYDQLNYHDNIERFFNSNIDASVNSRPFCSDEENIHSSANSSYESGKNNTSSPKLKFTSSTNGSGNSGSAENLSSESNNQQSFGSGGETFSTTSNNSTANDRFKHPILTESLLNRHNEDMEKLMVQKHREQKKGDMRNKSCRKAKDEQQSSRGNAYNRKSGIRLKRSGSHNWEDEKHFKMSKYDDTVKVPPNVNANHMPITANANFASTVMDTSNAAKVPNFIQRLPTCAAIPSTTTLTRQCFTTTNVCSRAVSQFFTYPQMFPVYYLPISQPRDNPPLTAIPQDHPGPTNLISQPTPNFPYMAAPMPSVMYSPIIGTSAPTAMMCRSYIIPDTITTTVPMSVIPQSSCPHNTTPPTTKITSTTASSFDTKHPRSRETSVKSEPGSTIALPLFSKKIFSPSGVVSTCLSNERGSFSSALNKSCDSSSNTDQRHTMSSFKPYQQSKENQANQIRNAFGMLRNDPPWIEGVKHTTEFVYQYQISPKSLNNVLKTDLEFLNQTKQPNLVNEQLGQLFLDLDLGGPDSKLILDEAGTNSDSSSNRSQSPSRMGAW